jgi:hypothetical protein
MDEKKFLRDIHKKTKKFINKKPITTLVILISLFALLMISMHIFVYVMGNYFPPNPNPNDSYTFQGFINLVFTAKLNWLIWVIIILFFWLTKW